VPQGDNAGHQFHPVIGGQPEAAGDLLLQAVSHHNGTIAARTGVVAAAPVGIDIDISGSFLRRRRCRCRAGFFGDRRLAVLRVAQPGLGLSPVGEAFEFGPGTSFDLFFRLRPVVVNPRIDTDGHSIDFFFGHQAILKIKKPSGMLILAGTVFPVMTDPICKLFIN